MVIRLGQRSPTGQWRQRLIDADWYYASRYTKDYNVFTSIYFQYCHLGAGSLNCDSYSNGTLNICCSCDKLDHRLFISPVMAGEIRDVNNQWAMVLHVPISQFLPGWLGHASVGTDHRWFATHLIHNLWAHYPNLVTTHIAFTWKIMIGSGHKFEHITTAELSWHVQICDLTRA